MLASITVGAGFGRKAQGIEVECRLILDELIQIQATGSVGHRIKRFAMLSAQQLKPHLVERVSIWPPLQIGVIVAIEVINQSRIGMRFLARETI